MDYSKLPSVTLKGKAKVIDKTGGKKVENPQGDAYPICYLESEQDFNRVDEIMDRGFVVVEVNIPEGPKYAHLEGRLRRLAKDAERFRELEEKLKVAEEKVAKKSKK